MTARYWQVHSLILWLPVRRKLDYCDSISNFHDWLVAYQTPRFCSATLPNVPTIAFLAVLKTNHIWLQEGHKPHLGTSQTFSPNGGDLTQPNKQMESKNNMQIQMAIPTWLKIRIKLKHKHVALKRHGGLNLWNHDVAGFNSKSF